VKEDHPTTIPTDNDRPGQKLEETMEMFRLNIKGRLILGFSIVCLLLASVVGITLVKVRSVSEAMDRTVSLRVPTALTASDMVANIYASLAWRFDAGVAALEGLSLVIGMAAAQALARLGERRRAPEGGGAAGDVAAHAPQQPALPADHHPGRHRHRQQQQRDEAGDAVRALPERGQAVHAA